MSKCCRYGDKSCGLLGARVTRRRRRSWGVTWAGAAECGLALLIALVVIEIVRGAL